MLPKVKYKEAQTIILAQRKAVYDKIKEMSHSHIRYPGLKDFKNGATSVSPENVPGLSTSIRFLFKITHRFCRGSWMDSQYECNVK